jgi:hypothetical protein
MGPAELEEAVQETARRSRRCPNPPEVPAVVLSIEHKSPNPQQRRPEEETGFNKPKVRAFQPCRHYILPILGFLGFLLRYLLIMRRSLFGQLGL